MPRLRRNEWNFSSNVAALINSALSEPTYRSSPMGHAEPELTEYKGAKRLDLVIFQREQPLEAIVTGELKVPWDPKGRTPYNSKVVDDAYGKAVRAGALYFITWNIRRAVVWKTDAPGIALQDRVVYDKEFVEGSIAGPEDLDRADVKEGILSGVTDLIAYLHSTLTGPPLPTFLPLDRLFIARLESALYFPIEATASALKSKLATNPVIKREFERWAREEQGWVVSRTNQDENVGRAARFACYVLVNRICFYDALRRRYGTLPRLSIPNNINTAMRLEARLSRAFADAKRYSGDYETVFDGDYGDRLPFLSDDAVPEWRSLVRTLDQYDFATIPLDVIGAMYEQLITPAERHRYGQHYTQPAIVDLINSFAIRNGNDTVLDPGCGGGTFLVRAYARKSFLDSTLEHSQLLEQIYGCDILNYACHLSTINLAIRDLIDEDNFPRIHLGDFLRYRPGRVFSREPVRLQAGGLITSVREIKLLAGQVDAIVGNPPYIEAKELTATDKEYYNKSAVENWPDYKWKKSSDIYPYFWTHSATFLKPEGRLALLTQAAWLDVEYGIPVQKWMCDNFRILAILETEVEPWFTDARVATVVTLLEEDNNEESRRENIVRFVQFRRRLTDIFGHTDSEHARQHAVEQLQQNILSTVLDEITDDYQLRVVKQADLIEAGTLPDGDYEGSKWGRYLRSTTTLYELQKTFRSKFCRLRDTAPVQRGITTNCDDFFIVSDCSEEALREFISPTEFSEHFGVSRSQVQRGDIKVVRRSDGATFCLENNHLRPVLKTARDFNWFATSKIEHPALLVDIQEDRASLSPLARAYVEAGERERWHLSPSFENLRQNGHWYSLRSIDVTPILFVKTMQYSPYVLFNDAALVANQRLYELRPAEGIDAKALCAVLNSTVFACERYAAVKALGREAAIDVEVFSANALRVPDIRQFSPTAIEELKTTMDELLNRTIESLVEEPLRELRLNAAKAYIATHPMTEGCLPAELRDATRLRLDNIVLRELGIPDEQVESVRSRMYLELASHVRKLKELELEAQVNRRGADATDVSPRELADDIWAHLLASGTIQTRNIPNDFLPTSGPTRTISIPRGNSVEIRNPSLFDTHSDITVAIGTHSLRFPTLEEANYVRLLAAYGISGEQLMPKSAHECATCSSDIEQYVRSLGEAISTEIAATTGDVQLQSRIFREAMRHVVERI